MSKLTSAVDRAVDEAFQTFPTYRSAFLNSCEYDFFKEKLVELTEARLREAGFEEQKPSEWCSECGHNVSMHHFACLARTADYNERTRSVELVDCDCSCFKH